MRVYVCDCLGLEADCISTFVCTHAADRIKISLCTHIRVYRGEIIPRNLQAEAGFNSGKLFLRSALPGR